MQRDPGKKIKLFDFCCFCFPGQQRGEGGGRSSWTERASWPSRNWCRKHHLHPRTHTLYYICQYCLSVCDCVFFRLQGSSGPMGPRAPVGERVSNRLYPSENIHLLGLSFFACIEHVTDVLIYWLQGLPGFPGPEGPPVSRNISY